MSVSVKKKGRKRASATADQAWMELVKRNLPLVKYVLGKISGNLPPCVDRDDLLAAGSMGLIESAKRYDPSRKVPFHSYAIPRIWGSMLDELRKHDWLSTDMREQVTKLERSMERLREQGKSHPGIADLSRDLGCPEKRVLRLMALAKSGQSQTGGDLSAVETTAGRLHDRVGARAPRGPYEEIEFRDRKEVLAKAIEALPDREKKVIVLRYNEGLYLHEIGKLLEVSESRICQIHTQALRRLRNSLKRVGIGT